MTPLMSITSGGEQPPMAWWVQQDVHMCAVGYHAADQRENESLKCLVYEVYCCCTAAQSLQRALDLLSQHSSEIFAVD